MFNWCSPIIRLLALELLKCFGREECICLGTFLGVVLYTFGTFVDAVLPRLMETSLTSLLGSTFSTFSVSKFISFSRKLSSKPTQPLSELKYTSEKQNKRVFFKLTTQNLIVYKWQMLTYSSHRNMCPLQKVNIRFEKRQTIRIRCKNMMHGMKCVSVPCKEINLFLIL